MLSLAEIAAILRLATSNPDLKRVIWGVDFYAFDERFAGFRHPETRVRLEGGERQVMALRISETLLSMRALEDSRRALMRARGGRKRGPLAAPVPWPEEVIRARLDDPGRPGLDRADETLLALQLTNWLANYSGYRPSDAQGFLYGATVASLRAEGIDVITFVPPLSRCELEVIEQTGNWPTLQRWKRALLSAGPYWDFSGYGKLDRDDALFLDAAHFWPAVGHVMLRRFLGEDCRGCGRAARAVLDAGVRVDAATVDAYLARQEAVRTASRQGSDRCVEVVAKMRRARASGAPARGSGSTWRGPAAEIPRHRAGDDGRPIASGRRVLLLVSSGRPGPGEGRAADPGPPRRRPPRARAGGTPPSRARRGPLAETSVERAAVADLLERVGHEEEDALHGGQGARPVPERRVHRLQVAEHADEDLLRRDRRQPARVERAAAGPHPRDQGLAGGAVEQRAAVERIEEPVARPGARPAPRSGPEAPRRRRRRPARGRDVHVDDGERDRDAEPPRRATSLRKLFRGS